MSKLEDSVNEILGLQPKPTMVGDKPPMVQKFEPPVKRGNGKGEDIDKDYDYSRDNYYNLIERGQEAIDGILDIAKEGQHPRAYEVAGQLIGQVALTVDKLQDLQKKLKDLKELPNKTTATIKNALFVGSTTELQKMLKGKNEDTKSVKQPPKEEGPSN